MTIKLCSGFGRYHTDRKRALATISFKEIAKLAGNPPSILKQNAQWFIPSTMLTRNKKRQVENGKFYALTADIDDNPPTLSELDRIVKSIVGKRTAQLIYLSSSATRKNQKSHIIIPTNKLSPYRWLLAQTVFNNKLIAAGIVPDLKVLDHNQIIYLPNRGDYYGFRIEKGAAFNPLLRKSWCEPMEAVHSEIEGKLEAAIKEKTVHTPPMAKKGDSLIDTFNNEIRTQDILIQAGYAVDAKGDNFKHPNSKTGNFSASVKNGRVFTLSSSDPLFTGNSAHDAFSAFTVLFHDGNLRAALIDAGNNWLAIGGASYNSVMQKRFKEGK